MEFTCAFSACDELRVADETDRDGELEIVVANGYDNRVYLKPHQVEELANHLLKAIGQDNG